MRATLATMLSALRYRNYRRWACADFVSVTGSWMQNLAVNWLVLTTTGSASMLGLSLLFQTLPGLLLGSWGGALADRFPVRRILLVTQVLHAVLALGLAAIAHFHAPVTAVYGLSVLSGLVTVFDGPALGRFGSQLVARDNLGNALGMGSVLSSAGRILGMSLAGALVAVTGEAWLFVLNALTFVGVITAIASVRSSEIYPLARSSAARTGVKAGLRYVLGYRPLVVLFLLSFVLSCLGRNYQITMAAMSEGPLGGGAVGYSALSVVFAVGTVVGGLLGASRPELTLRILLVMAGATSVLEMVSGSAWTLVLFAVVLFPIAAGAVVIDTALSTRLQLDSDEDMRGRVLSVKAMVTSASGAAGGPLLGWLAQEAGPGHALQIAGALATAATLVATALLAWMPERRAMPDELRWRQLGVPQVRAEQQPQDAEQPEQPGSPATAGEPAGRPTPAREPAAA